MLCSNTEREAERRGRGDEGEQSKINKKTNLYLNKLHEVMALSHNQFFVTRSMLIIMTLQYSMVWVWKMFPFIMNCDAIGIILVLGTIRHIHSLYHMNRSFQ